MSFSIIGTGSCVPAYAADNNKMASLVDTSDEWISSRTGIKKRHIITDETLLDLTLESARKALADADVAPEELDLILCATLQGDYISPAMACLLQRELGAVCPAFDINAACSGFLFALDIAASYFRAGRVKKMLIVCAEHLSKLADWSDRSTCVLFGDATGAAVLGEGDGLLDIKIKTKGNHEFLNIPAYRFQTPFAGAVREKSGIFMNGQEIYKFAVSTIENDSAEMLDSLGLSLDDIDLFLLHQANGRIIEAAYRHLNQPAEKFPMNISEYGNTSAATIPLLLDEVNKNGRLRKGDLILFSAFGGGLTSGTCVLRW